MDARWDPRSRSDVVGNAARPMTKTLRVLIVDDETDLLDELRDTLEAAGFSVITASSATEAFAMVRNNRSIGIVVVDLLMPDLHGLEFVEKVRLLERGHAIRFIAMTGRAAIEDVIRAMRLGVRSCPPAWCSWRMASDDIRQDRITRQSPRTGRLTGSSSPIAAMVSSEM